MAGKHFTRLLFALILLTSLLTFGQDVGVTVQLTGAGGNTWFGGLPGQGVGGFEPLNDLGSSSLGNSIPEQSTVPSNQLVGFGDTLQTNNYGLERFGFRSSGGWEGWVGYMGTAEQALDYATQREVAQALPWAMMSASMSGPKPPIGGFYNLPTAKAGDLIMGLTELQPVGNRGSLQTALFTLRRALGGKGNIIAEMIGDLEIKGNLFDKFTRAQMDNLAPGNVIHFNLDGIKPGWMNPNSEFGMSQTSQELRYIKDNWGGRFSKSNVIFYRGGQISQRLPWGYPW